MQSTRTAAAPPRKLIAPFGVYLLKLTARGDLYTGTAEWCTPNFSAERCSVLCVYKHHMGTWVLEWTSNNSKSILQLVYSVPGGSTALNRLNCTLGEEWQVAPSCKEKAHEMLLWSRSRRPNSRPVAKKMIVLLPRLGIEPRTPRLVISFLRLPDCYEISEHFTNFCWVCFTRKTPASNLLYNILWVQEDERIVNQAEKNMDVAGIEPMTSRCKTST
jgi:hypothetical protein